MRLTRDLVEIAIEAACSHLTENLDKHFVYHDLSHTVFVVEAAASLAKKMGLSKQQRMLLTVAAWFHDTGYSVNIEDHELHGASLAARFLKEYNIDEEEITTVRNLILATKYPQHPKTILEQVICDADMMHLGAKDFWVSSGKLREEWRLTKDLNYSNLEWLELNIKFLSGHRYHTAYAREFCEARKEKNVAWLKTEKKQLEQKEVDTKAESKKEKLEKGKLERGVETLFKTASGNHMRLSGMADNKAHILLSINSIIISVILSVLTKKLTEATYLILPTVMLLCVSVTTIVFAVLATKPKVSKGTFTKEQINNKEVNLLFFGNFHQMELELFEWGIQEVIYDKDYLYKTMTKDIYFLGKVLAVKYRYLNIGYKIFMFGLIASVITFATSFLLMAHA